MSSRESRLAHDLGTCGCSVLENLANCKFQPFLDGWKFIPDIGNGQKRGEIFTPRFIVDRMIVSSGILPREAVYEYKYTGTKESMKRYICERIFEPGVGTGNFAATILWHKIEFANSYSQLNIKNSAENMKTSIGRYEIKKKKRGNELKIYQIHTLLALSSLYLNDADPGNLQSVKHRILRQSEINSEENIAYWVESIKKTLDMKVSEKKIKDFVSKSIKDAGRSWGALDEDKGVLDVLYKKHTGTEPPPWLKDLWALIIDNNIKLFNSIVKSDTTNLDTIVPGYGNVIWDFWGFSYNRSIVKVSRSKVALLRQIMIGDLLISKKKIEKMCLDAIKTYFPATEPLFGGELIPEEILSKKNLGEYRKLAKKIEHIENTLKSQYEGNVHEITLINTKPAD